MVSKKSTHGNPTGILLFMRKLGSTKRLFLLSNAHGTKADDVFSRVTTTLRRAGFDADWGPRLNSASQSYDLIILNHADDAIGSDLSRVHILGLDVLNRAERLMVADSLGVPVAPWASPSTADEISRLFDRWQVDRVLLKRDGTFQRSGVSVVTKGDHDQIMSGRDVLMKILEGDSITYKVDAFVDKPLHCYRYHTPSVLHPSFSSAEPAFDSFAIPPALASYIALIGRALLSFGCGYYSADFMYDGGWYLIEINTSGVAMSGPWFRWPDIYSENYSQAIISCMESNEYWPTQADVERRVKLWRKSRAPKASSGTE